MSAGWNGIEDWKCASKGCCYDDKGPFTVGTDNIRVSQPVCFYPNGAQSNYDLHGSFAAAGTLPSHPSSPCRPLAIPCTASSRLGAMHIMPKSLLSTLCDQEPPVLLEQRLVLLGHAADRC